MRCPAWPGWALLFLIAATIAHAQETRVPENRFIADKLYRIPGGYFGITPLADGGTITQYNDTLANAASSVLGGITPIDFSYQATTGNGQGVLLASQLGRGSLYGVRLNSSPEIVPIWESPLPPFRRIVELGDFDRDGIMEVAVVGDSAFTVVGIDGKERFTRLGVILDALVLHDDTIRFVLIARSNDDLLITLLDSRDGHTLAMRAIPARGDVVMRLMETAGGEALVIAMPGERPGAYILDPTSFAPPDRIELPFTPIALIPYQNGRGLLPAALFSTYPAPTLLPLGEEETPFRIDYPFTGVPENAYVTGNYIVLLSRDSLALYDRAMRLRAMLPSVGSADATVTLVDSTKMLIASSAGSRIISLPITEISWFERNWLFLLSALAGAILIGSAIAASRRYRFVRTVYNNLVRVPSSHGVIVISPRQRIQHINQSAREMVEVASYIPLGRHVTEYLVSEELRPILPPLRRLFADGEEFEERVDVTREGALRSYTFRGRPLLGRYGTTAGFLLLVEDVTQTLERERLVNWASVAHHIAHEMKTPLSTVAMTAQMLLDRMNGNGIEAEYARATTRIVKQSARLREIVEDLLTIARTEALQKGSTDLSVLLSSLVHDFHDYLPKNVDLRLEISNGNYRCMADVGQLLVALRNLLENAAQAIGTREGGLIRVSLLELPEALSIIFEDNGVGMSPETLAKLFQPFYTERQGGSGIGTVIIKRVIEGHGGTIHVESQRGKGTRFVVSLPRT